MGADKFIKPIVNPVSTIEAGAARAADIADSLEHNKTLRYIVRVAGALFSPFALGFALVDFSHRYIDTISYPYWSSLGPFGRTMLHLDKYVINLAYHFTNAPMNGFEAFKFYQPAEDVLHHLYGAGDAIFIAIAGYLFTKLAIARVRHHMKEDLHNN